MLEAGDGGEHFAQDHAEIQAARDARGQVVELLQVGEPLREFVAQDLEFALRGARAQQALNHGQQHFGVEGLREVSVGAALEPLNLVRRRAEGGGQVDDRDARGPLIGADDAAHFAAVDIGQLDVKEDQVREFAFQRGQGFGPGSGVADAVTGTFE